MLFWILNEHRYGEIQKESAAFILQAFRLAIDFIIHKAGLSYHKIKLKGKRFTVVKRRAIFIHT